MTAFSYNANIDVALRGTTVVTLTVDDGNQNTADQYSVNQSFSIGFEGEDVKKFVLSDTSENGVTTGTILTATSILKDNGGDASNDTLATAANVGGIAVGFGFDDGTQGEMLTALSLALQGDSGFGASFFDSVVLSGTGDGNQTLILTVNGKDVTSLAEDIYEFTAVHTKNPTKDNLGNKRWETLVAGLDDDAAIAAELQSRMGTSDSGTGGGYVITNASVDEYQTKFIPGLREFLKKVK